MLGQSDREFIHQPLYCSQLLRVTEVSVYFSDWSKFQGITANENKNHTTGRLSE